MPFDLLNELECTPSLSSNAHLFFPKHDKNTLFWRDSSSDLHFYRQNKVVPKFSRMETRCRILLFFLSILSVRQYWSKFIQDPPSIPILVWKLIETEQWGWVRQYGDSHLARTTLPSDEIFKLIHFSFKGDFSEAQCSFHET